MSLARFLPVILATLMLMVAQPGLAKTYKWVDENGVTQYTQTPPPKGDFERVKEPPPPAIHPEEAKKQLQERVDAFSERRSNEQKSQEEADKKSADAGQKADNCQKARKNLEYFQSKSRIRYTDKDGNVTAMSEEDRQKRISDLQTKIKENCK